MALSRLLALLPTSDRRPLQIRVRGLPEAFAEWEMIGALAGLARERELDVRVEWVSDDAPGGRGIPRPDRRPVLASACRVVDAAAEDSDAP